MRLFELYTKSNAMARDYFRHLDQHDSSDGFDPDIHFSLLDYWFYNESGLDGEYTLDGPEDWDALPEEVQAEFLEWYEENGEQMADEEGHSAQHFMLAKKNLLPRTTWLVHFCDDPDGIRRNGFTLGTDDIEKLGLTTYQKKYGPGYNFAFVATSRYADWAAHKGKYGQHAVVFQGSGVLAHHHGDQEEQVIFYGPDVPKHGIIPIYHSREDGEWYVSDRRTDRRLVSGDYEKVAAWVMQNGRQYQAIL